MNELYLSLGSNIGDRKKHLTDAILLIKIHLGKVTKKAAIYQTPAWGFESTPFLNTCICITTKLTTEEALINLQTIEKELGRKAKITTDYEARPIDIDIIYASEGIFNLPNLVVPHPLMQERKFVLVPLLDIAADIIHPLLHINTKELLTTCGDDSEVIEFN